MIILEGADGSGKTTMAKILSEQLGMEIYHSGGPVKTTEELFSRIDTQLSKTGMIVDRCSVFSEPVYGFAIRKYSLLNKDHFDRYVKKMVKDKWSVVWCTSDGRDRIVKGKEWKSKEHMDGVTENYRMLQVGYNIVMSRAMGQGLNVIPFDSFQFTNKELVSAVQWLIWQVKPCAE